MTERDLYKAACASGEFVMRHHPQSKEWGNVVDWCAWYISNGFMVAMHRDDRSIGALAAARPVNCAEDGNIPYKHSNDGPCIFIDFMAIEDHHPLVLPAFGIELRQRFGDRKMVAYQRVSEHNYENFLRNIGRINKIGEPYYGATTTA